MIIGAGGDTTISIISAQILRFQKNNVLGIISLGSVNDLARELGVHKLEDAADAIKIGNTCTVDVGVITSKKQIKPHYFLVCASLGLGVMVNRYVDTWMQKHPFFSSYRSTTQRTAAISAIRQAFKNKDLPLKFTLESRGKIHNIVSSLLIFSNAASFGGTFRVSPTASPISGKLDCCIINASSFANVVGVSVDIKRQKHLVKNKVKVLSDECFKIYSKTPLDFLADGKIITTEGDIKISIIPKAQKFITNANFLNKRISK